MTAPLDRVEVFAPGCIGNIGPGLDILGLAVTGPGDTVVAERIASFGVRITGAGHPDLPADPMRHTAGIAAREVLSRAGENERGVALTITKGLPLAGGQGGSAATAVAAAVAVNALLGEPLDQQALLSCCLVAEATVAGRHLDNIAPCLLGGAVLIRSLEPIDVIALPVPDNLVVVLVHPAQRLETRAGREALPTQVDRNLALYQAAQVAAIVAGFASGDLRLVGRAIDDRIAEPARAPLLPGFLAAKAAALAAGALGCSISGSGPTAFAFAAKETTAAAVSLAMAAAYRDAGFECQARIARVDRVGARVVGPAFGHAAGKISASPPAVSPTSCQRCLRCGDRLSDLDSRVRCDCGGLLELEHSAPSLQGEPLARLFGARRTDRDPVFASGVWRFKELVHPSAIEVLTHPEGNTPLLRRAAIARWAGIDWLALKHEGHNPTGSFKDRGMTVGITQAHRVGASAVACASTGNTAASLAAYAALAGIPALVLVPAGQVAIGKLAQSLAYGAGTLLVRGDFDDCLRLVGEAQSLGVYLLNSINPFRLEGQKTIVLELLEQLDWEAPDWIALPAGNLGNTAAFGKALAEAKSARLIRRLPRLAAIQAAGAAPFYESYRGGFARPFQVKADTIATAIRIGNPASYDRAVRSIQETAGVVEAVSDGEILEAKAVVDAAGVGCEPASAASIAGVRKLVRSGTILPGERVVAVLTGHLLKDPGALIRYHQETEPPPEKANRPIEIEASLGAVEKALARRLADWQSRITGREGQR